MHEMGIAASVLDIVRQYVPEAQAPLVRRVRVRVGELAGVQTDSLTFCFEAIVSGTAFGGASLEVEHVPATRACRDCGHRFESRDVIAVCPSCGGAQVPLLQGTELQVAEVELDDEPAGGVA